MASATKHDGFEAEAAARLSEAGFRRTPRRVRILAFLLRAQRPIGHPEIHRALGRPAPDRVSLYRALNAFAAKGLLHRVFAGGRTWLYETADRCGADHCHPHFTCRACGAVTCLVGVDVPVAKRLEAGYVAERQRVHITGLCPQCHGAAGAG